MRLLDGGRPSRTLGWVQAVAPVVTQAAAGAGHWAAGRRQRALAEWAGAAGFGLVAWGLGTEAPTAAEVQENIRQQMDLMRKPGTQAPATAGTETPAARRLSRFFRRYGACFPGSVDGHQRAVAPAPPAAADGARDRHGSPERRV